MLVRYVIDTLIAAVSFVWYLLTEAIGVIAYLIGWEGVILVAVIAAGLRYFGFW